MLCKLCKGSKLREDRGNPPDTKCSQLYLLTLHASISLIIILYKYVLIASFALI